MGAVATINSDVFRATLPRETPKLPPAKISETQKVCKCNEIEVVEAAGVEPASESTSSKEETFSNRRAAAAKLRWAVRALP